MTEVLLVGAVFGALGFVLGVVNFIEIRAMQKSTHQIQYVYPDAKVDKQGFEEINDTTKEKFDPDFYM